MGLAKKVAFLGFVLGGGDFARNYRDGAFGGFAQGIVPILDAAPQIEQVGRISCGRSSNGVLCRRLFVSMCDSNIRTLQPLSR